VLPKQPPASRIGRYLVHVSPVVDPVTAQLTAAVVCFLLIDAIQYVPVLVRDAQLSASSFLAVQTTTAHQIFVVGINRTCTENYD